MQSMQSRGLLPISAVLEYKSGGRSSAQVVQRSVCGVKRNTQGAQTCCAGQLLHTAHWLTRDGSGNGRLNRGANRRLNTPSIYSCSFILKIHDNIPAPPDS
jgi:hypothetical protein